MHDSKSFISVIQKIKQQPVVEQTLGLCHLIHFIVLFPFVSFTYFVTCYVFFGRTKFSFFGGEEGEKTSKAQVLFFLFLCYCLLFGVAYLLLLIWLMTDRRISRRSWGSGRRKQTNGRWSRRRGRRRYVWHAGRWWLELNRKKITQSLPLILLAHILKNKIASTHVAIFLLFSNLMSLLFTTRNKKK